MTDSRQKRLDKAQLKTLFQVPFFAPGVAKLPVIFDDSVETACTDGECIRWNGPWFDSLPDQVLVTLLCHEVAHCLLGHLWRLPPPGGDHEVANQAADHAVNLMLKEFSAMVTAKRLADPFPFPTDKEGLADPQFSNMSEEAIYAKLMAGQQGQCQNGGVPAGAGAKRNGSSESNHPATGKNSPNGNVGSKNARQDLPSFGQFKPKAGSQAAGKKLKSHWERTLIQSVAAMKGCGELPAGLERLVNGLVSPSVGWWNVLRSWLREQCADDWDFLTPCMEMSDGAFILPTLKSEKMGPVIFATDTSGSIDSEMLARFQSEKQACLDEMRPKTLLDVYCDAKIQAVREYAVGDEIKRDCPGGGGTSFVPVWDEIEKRGVSPKCLAYLTDLDGDFGADPGYPVVWVTWTKDGKAPFGTVIYAGK